MKKAWIYIIVCVCTGLLCYSCTEEGTNQKETTEATVAPAKKTESNGTSENTPAKAVIKEKPTHITGKDNRHNEDAQTGSRRERLLQLVNDARAKGCRCGGRYYKPVPPLTWNNKLERAAQKHSRYMRRRNVLGHGGQGGSDAGRRISAEGYDWISYGENVAAGYGSDEATIKGWLKSKGHCKNIMSPKFKEMGMASSGQFYTQVFGSRR